MTKYKLAASAIDRSALPKITQRQRGIGLKNRQLRWAALSSLALALSAPTVGHAQTDDAAADIQTLEQTSVSNNKATGALRTYDANYFTDYAPRTALDMVRRLPGFQLTSGSSKRGMGQGGANVLLNGERLTGKQNDPFAQLGRISASNVTQIEILDGASLNIPGLTGDVANIITKSKGMSGTWEWQPEWRKRLKPNLLAATATLSGERGDLAYTAELRNNSFRQGHQGPELRYQADGTLFQTLVADGQYYGDNPGGALNLTWKPITDHTGHLNLEYNQFNFNDDTLSDYIANTDAGFDGQSIYRFAEDEWNAKIDGDYEFPLGPGKLKFIGYYRTEYSPTHTRYDLYNGNQLISQTRYNQTADEGEAIFRTEYSWQRQEGRDWQLSGEGVYNYLKNKSDYVDLLNPDNSAVFDPVKIDEDRGEVNLTHTRKLSEKWDLQASIGAEYSQITQGTLKRDFVRPKGYLNVSYKPADNYNLRARLEREIGQLNFFDFIASIDLQDGINRDSNSNIVPSQSWVGELEFDRQFTGGHSFKIRGYGSLISDLVDRIPVGDDGEAVGNIDKANRYGVEISATLKSDPLGFKGLQLDGEYNWRRSSVKDPVEGFTRRLNRDLINSFEVNLRYDIDNTNWAIGGGLYDDTIAPAYLLRVINSYNFNGPFASIYVENKDVMGMKVKFDLRNLTDASDDIYRVFYDDRRDLGEVDSWRRSSRKSGIYARLTVSGTF